ncbi:Phosphotransferase [Paramicrosporidium saccamoebae]|uniref:Phosphotransferase n=1 Tax=Paramicrosporidium saccamoebae TaxID=1246581 RepID=A0A2H9TK98_9FUNG|nr:Phosphotransferase [Paramicrosporidium saccamoebae]
MGSTTLTMFNVSLETLQTVADNFHTALMAGLCKEGQMIRALPSFVCELPSGREEGDFLVVDLGGTNLRVGCAQLKGNGQFGLDMKRWALVDEMKNKAGCELFDLIADCVKSYLKDSPHQTMGEALKGRPISLGFTFSYPVKQDDIDHGILIQWNKALVCNDVIGLDVVALLQDALNKTDLANVKVSALLNDTVGTLAAHAYVDVDTKISVLLGTGTNAAFIAPLSLVKKLAAHPTIQSHKEMIINTEWGAFGDGNGDLLPLLPLDKKIDSETVNPGAQILEKLLGGMYLGEIARLALELQFGDGQMLGKPFDLETADLSKIEIDDGHGGVALKEKLGWRDFDDTALQQAKDICRSVVKRSAQLCAAMLVGIYRLLGKPRTRTVVAFDGSLYEKYPRYSEYLEETIAALEPGHTMEFQLRKDGSIIGAAVIVAARKS